MPLSRCFLLMAAIAALSWPVQADILYVDDDAPPGGDGLSWDTAYPYMRDAIGHAAASGGAVTEIRVAQGTYRPHLVTPVTTTACCDVHDSPGCDTAECQEAVCPHIPYCCDTTWDAACVALAELFCGDLCEDEPEPPPTFRLLNGVTLRGGYAGLGTPDPDARDVGAYPSILDGDIEGNDDSNPDGCCTPHDTPGCDDPSPDEECEAAVCAELPYCCETAWDLLCVVVARSPYFCDREVSCPGIADNVHIVTATDTDPSALLDGFTVTHGARGVSIESGAATVRECTIVDNEGGLSSFFGSATVTECTYSGNTIGLVAGAGSTVTNCILTDNAGWNGAGLYSAGATVVGCTVSNNRAVQMGGGLYVDGGTVVDTVITGNRANWSGGGLRLEEGTVIGCTIGDNDAGYAGGGVSIEGDGEIIGSVLANNTAAVRGGGAEFSAGFDYIRAAPRIVNSLLIGNSADQGGGVASDVSLEVFGCTVANNVSAAGGGLHTWAPLSVLNSVVWDNTPDEIVEASPDVAAVGFSDVRGGFPGDGNIDADPLFVDPEAGDFRLAPGSPCIDAGHSMAVTSGGVLWEPGRVHCDYPDLDEDGDTSELMPVDLGGNARFADDPDTPDTGCAAGPIIDMGAYEFGDSPPGERVLYADRDGDGEVAVVEFLAMLAAWGTCADPCCLADVAVPWGGSDCRMVPASMRDGVVDVVDFYALLGWWGE